MNPREEPSVDQCDSVASLELLANWRRNPDEDPHSIDAVYEELLRTQHAGEEPSVSVQPRRFPSKSDGPDNSISRRPLFRSGSGSSHSHGLFLQMPDVGDEVFGFRIRGELGRGAFARVFLAEQAELADRPVVVKLSAREGTEPQTLAQLQHTNIVPIYSVHDDPQLGIRAVCMPYFGGASLSQVLRELWSSTKLPLEGRQLVDAMQRVAVAAVQPTGRTMAILPDTIRTDGQGAHPAGQDASASCASDGEGQTPLDRLNELSYVQTVAWIIARLAEGLEHAHNRGVLHRDVKPSNVLLSGDGQPLLLDFNLSQNQLGDVVEATLGGTVSYMSPEHLRALIGHTPELVRHVDRRSDVYSLGMVLHEMLAGHSPFEQSASYSAAPLQIEAMALERGRAVPSIRQQRPDVPWSLESIARKCLAPDQTQRYQRAEHVAEDLRRFLTDQPLKYAPELSWLERCQKWMRRHPRLAYSAAVTSVAAIALVVIGTALSSARTHLATTRGQLSTVQDRDRRADFEAGTVRALCLVNTVVPLEDHMSEGVAMCEQTLNLYGVLEGTAWLEPQDWSHLPAGERQKLAEDARELLVLLAAARVQATPDDSSTLRDALSLLDRAGAIPGLSPSQALWLDRARYLTRLGDTVAAADAVQKSAAITAGSARDHYLLATAYARSGDRAGFTRAITALDEAIRLQPRHYWSWVQRGFCHFELGEHLLAAADFGHCTGLWPEFAWGYFNRGRVFDEIGKKAEAVREYTAALERDPNLVAAYVNRGLASLELGQHQAAVTDFDTALTMGKSDATLIVSRGVALEALGRYEEANVAFETAVSEAERLPAVIRRRILWASAFAISSRRPAEAQAAFERVIAEDPENVQSLYGLAMLAMNTDESTRALEFFDRALTGNPEFLEARRYRAILLARLGRLDQASQDINRCLEKEPSVGATLYAAACVASLAANELAGDAQVTEQALDLLGRAVAHGAGLDKAQTDPDLATLRKHPKFQELIQSAVRKP